MPYSERRAASQVVPTPHQSQAWSQSGWCVSVLTGNTSSDYLWCVDPLDGTTNFAHGYPSFGVSVAVLRHAMILASCVIEFTGHWPLLNHIHAALSNS